MVFSLSRSPIGIPAGNCPFGRKKPDQQLVILHQLFQSSRYENIYAAEKYMMSAIHIGYENRQYGFTGEQLQSTGGVYLHFLFIFSKHTRINPDTTPHPVKISILRIN